jgi:hypothetical protein
MPKSKAFIEDSDSEESKNVDKNNSASDEEFSKTSVSKKSKAKNSNTKNDVSHFNKQLFHSIELFFLSTSHQLNELKQMIVVWLQPLDLMVNDSTK